MSTCGICLKSFDPFSQPHLYRQTRGHNSCVDKEEADSADALEVQNLELKDRVTALEDENDDLEREVKELRRNITKLEDRILALDRELDEQRSISN